MFIRGSFRYPYIVRLMGTGDMLSLSSVASSWWRSDGIVFYSSIPILFSISNDWLLIDSYEPPGQFLIDSHGGLVQYHNIYYYLDTLLFHLQILIMVKIISFAMLFTDKIGIPAVYRLGFIIGGMMKIKLVSSSSMELLIICKFGNFLVVYKIDIILVLFFFIGLFVLFFFFKFGFFVCFVFCFLFVLCFGFFFFLNLSYVSNLNLNFGLFL